MEQNSKSGLSGHEAGLPGWPTLLRGDQVRNSGCPIYELRARTNKDKGKDGLWVKGKDGQEWVIGQGQGQSRARTVKGKDSQGQGHARMGKDGQGQ